MYNYLLITQQLLMDAKHFCINPLVTCMN